MATGLYGIKHSNRTVDEHWGKNRFNSSFPTALASYMLEHDLPAIYIRLDENSDKPKVVATEISLQEVFNTPNKTTDDLSFHFETVFAPYQDFSFDRIDGIDLVVKNTNGEFLTPLEVKLTVLPTDGTSKLHENKWGCELVIRSATTSYCALGMYNAVKERHREVREIFEDTCSSIQMWDNNFEMTHKMPQICSCIDGFQKKFVSFQKPLLMQTIWKTQGKSPLLADNAFDVVVWSDYAFSRLFIDSSNECLNEMSRPMRATARLARCLWELSKSGKIRMTDIYRQMAFGNQTDKEFAINGDKWRRYVSSDRIITPLLKKEIVNEIIDPQYLKKLSPERRFDQTLYFTMKQ